MSELIYTRYGTEVEGNVMCCTYSMFIDRFGDIILINHERPYRNIEYYIPTAFDGITVDEHTSYIDDMKAWKRYTQECTT